MNNIYRFDRERKEDDQHVLEASEWIARMDRGLSNEDAEALLAWMRADSRNEEQLLKMARIWDKMDVLARLSELFPHASGMGVVSVRRMSRPSAIAASFIAVIAGFVMTAAIMNPGNDAPSPTLASAVAAYETAMNRPLIEPKKSYNIDEIASACSEMRERVGKRNNRLLIFLLDRFGLLPTQIIKISDLNCYLRFSWRQGLHTFGKVQDQSFVEMTSESLYFLFKFDFGIDTLNVNARFSGSLAQKKSLIRTFSPLALNNTGRYISMLGLISTFSEPAFIKQGLRTVGLAR